jgi:hypothetical protein
MKYWLLSIFSWICLLNFAQGQNLADSVSMEKKDSLSMVITSIPVDSTIYYDEKNITPPIDTTSIAPHAKRNFQPQVYFDYGKLIPTALGMDTKLEGGIALIFFEHFEAVAEYGKATLTPEHAYVNGKYESRGEYMRFGGGVITDVNAKSNIGLGVRYGISKYHDQISYGNYNLSGLQPDLIDSSNRPIDGSNFTARWWSIVLTSESRLVFDKSKPESKINHLVKIGFFFRMRFLVTYDNDPDPVAVYSIPGYGSTVNTMQPAFNLFIKFTP